MLKIIPIYILATQTHYVWVTSSSSVLVRQNINNFRVNMAKPCHNAPFIFTGTCIPSEPHLYLGMSFRKSLHVSLLVDFIVEVTHFIGINFRWKAHNNIYLRSYVSSTICRKLNRNGGSNTRLSNNQIYAISLRFHC